MKDDKCKNDSLQTLHMSIRFSYYGNEHTEIECDLLRFPGEISSPTEISSCCARYWGEIAVSSRHGARESRYRI